MQTETHIPIHFRRRRSFVRRDGRRTAGQERAHAMLWPQFGLRKEDGCIDLDQIFARKAPRFLEIGFGSGQSLLALAEARPDCDFIGIETHTPGVGALFLGIQLKQLTNLRVYYDDAVEVFQQSIPNNSLDGIQIFFPDPWQKRRHHARRIIQVEFVEMLVSKLVASGTLHLATDWEDYARHMMQVVSSIENLENLAGIRQFSTRSPYRPIVTKFEKRAEREGRQVWELQLRRRDVVHASRRPSASSA